MEDKEFLQRFDAACIAAAYAPFWAVISATIQMREERYRDEMIALKTKKRMEMLKRELEVIMSCQQHRAAIAKATGE